MQEFISGRKILWIVALGAVLMSTGQQVFRHSWNMTLVQLARRTSEITSDSPRTILVTGGLGKLGKILCPYLVRAGYFVVLVDVVNRTEGFLGELAPEQVQIFLGNIQNRSLLSAIQTRYGQLVGIIHLAGVTREDWCEEHMEECFHINVNSTRSFLHGLASTFNRTDVKRPWMIFTSAFSICERQIPSRSRSLILSKLEAESVIRRFSQLFSQTIVLRLADIYGFLDDDPTRTIPYFVRQAIAANPVFYTEFTVTENYIYITDVIRVLLELIPPTGGYSERQRASAISTVCLSASSIDRRSLLSTILNITDSPSLVQTTHAIQQSQPQFVNQLNATSLSFRHLLHYKNIETGLRQYIAEIRGRDLRVVKNLFRKECVENLVQQADFHNCTMIIYADSTMRSMLTCRSEGLWRKTEQIAPDFRFISANIKNTRGVSGYYIRCLTTYESYLRVVNRSVTKSMYKSVFFLSYAAENRSVALLTYADNQTKQLFSVQLNGSLQLWDGIQHLYFLSPYCCEGRAALPLLRADYHLEKQKQLSWYNHSKIARSKCRRLTMFIDQETAINRTRYLSREVPHAPAMKVTPTITRDQPLCDRDCALFTGCVLLHQCRCVPDRCRAKHTDEFVFSTTSKIQTFDPSEFRRIPFSTLMRRFAKDFYQQFDLPRIHVLDVPSTLIPYYNDSNRDSLHRKHCFNADDIILRGLKALSTNISAAELIAIPFFHGFYMHYRSMYYSHQVQLIQRLDAFANRSLAEMNSSAKVVFILTHDSGGCIGFAWNHLSLTRSLHNHQMLPLRNAYLLQPNGDFNTYCYYPDKDTVIPPFTCLTPELLASFHDLRRIKSVTDRRVLAFFSGTVWGSGLATRARLSCPSLWLRTWNQTTRGMTLIQSYYNGSNYLTTLNETRFCLIVPGTMGWTPRLVDSIYAGCIPVLISSSTHYPFEDILDYEKFTIHVPENRLDTLEETLLSVNENQLIRMQANVLRVRTAFLFENYQNPTERLDRRDSPLSLILLSLRMRLSLQVI